MTEDEALQALNLYMIGDIDLNALEERIIPLAFIAESKERELIDRIAIELSYIKDGVSDEAILRERLYPFSVPKQDTTVRRTA
jgi:hypothetical protein